MLSDEESSDSESGIRFKTATTRNKSGSTQRVESPSFNYSRSFRERSRSRESKHRRSTNRNRITDSSDHRRRHPSRSRSSTRNRRVRSRSRSTTRNRRVRSRSRSTTTKRRVRSRSRSHTRIRRGRSESRSRRNRTRSLSKSDRMTKLREETPECNISKRAADKVSKELLEPFLSSKNFQKSRIQTLEDENETDKKRHKRKEKEAKKTDILDNTENSTAATDNVDTKVHKSAEVSSLQFGPALPPSINTVKRENVDDCNSSKSYDFKNMDSESDNETFGPTLPPQMSKSTTTTPTVPEIKETKIKLKRKSLPHEINSVCNLSDKQEEVEDDESSFIGPIVPQRQEPTKSKLIGPVLPPHLKQSTNLNPGSTQSEENLIPGIVQPETNLIPGNTQPEANDDDFIGPLPAGETSTNPSFLLLEERALQMKIDQLTAGTTEVTVREEWMLELPEVRAANLGLGPRQFRKTQMPDMKDRSSWTDTPQDKAKKKEIKETKVDIRREAELEQIQTRNLEQHHIVEKHKKKKKRDKSLLDLHQEKLKKQQESKDSTQTERRPFSRDIDLKVNQFDNAQKKAILKKAQLLDNRFSSGESKFL